MLSEAILVVAVFCGSAVTALAGFAGYAAANGLLLQLYPPQRVLPLIMLCSVATQVTCLVRLRCRLDLHACLPLIAGGLAGVPLAIMTLDAITPRVFRCGFGAFLVTYSLYMALRRIHRCGETRRDVLTSVFVGFAGGLVGA